MILTGNEIIRARADGEIIIEPFSIDQVNPNSYNFRLGDTLRVYDEGILDPRKLNSSKEIHMGSDGYVLEPGCLYLAHTVERLGGEVYAPTFAARSSVARLGIFINLSASLGDIGFVGQWTLQLFATHRIRVYPGMLIGQMMWWECYGDVDLYAGKYQGSVGPRVSDIYLDYQKTLARDMYPRIGSDCDLRDVGRKFAALSVLAGRIAIPDGFSISRSVLEASAGSELLAAVRNVAHDLHATVGAFIIESAERLAEITARFRLDDRIREMLALRIADIRKSDPQARLVVRSSGLSEDGEKHSHAGVYRSVLGLRSVGEVVSAVEAAWRAWYELPALLSRIRVGDFSASPQIALFVQLMVNPQYSGVAFTCSAGEKPITVRIESVMGLGDGLVSGASDSETWFSGDGLPGDGRDLMLFAVEELVREVAELQGGNVDIEWAWASGKAWLLQVRPVTASLPGTQSHKGPYLRIAELYSGELPNDLELGDIAAVYASYVAKRGPAYRAARVYEFPTAEGIVMPYNRAALHEESVRRPLDDLLAAVPAEELVIDLSENLRQIICTRGEVMQILENHVAGCSAWESASVVLRPFLRGEAGIITSITEAGILAEVAPDGLLALNRGTVTALQAIVTPGKVTAIDDVGHEALTAMNAARRKLQALSHELAVRFGAMTLEWVLHDGELWFTDFSAPTAACGGAALSGKTLSAGVYMGDVVDLRDQDEVLQRLSMGPAVSINKSFHVDGYGPVASVLERVRATRDRPVVRASRPYAVLSVLIDDVGAFVFDGGSALCHLAILLREAHVPAVVVTGELASRVLVADGQVVPA